MYRLLLILHNINRWVVLALALFALARAYRGWLGGRNWTARDRQAGTLFTIFIDVQLLLGLALVALSPLIRAALQNLQGAMAADQLRFFLVEHTPLMILALVLVHLGSALSRRATEDRQRHRRAAIWYTLALLIIAFAVPWWRPLLRGLL